MCLEQMLYSSFRVELIIKIGYCKSCDNIKPICVHITE